MDMMLTLNNQEMTENLRICHYLNDGIKIYNNKYQLYTPMCDLLSVDFAELTFKIVDEIWNNENVDIPDSVERVLLAHSPLLCDEILVKRIVDVYEDSSLLDDYTYRFHSNQKIKEFIYEDEMAEMIREHSANLFLSPLKRFIFFKKYVEESICDKSLFDEKVWKHYSNLVLNENYDMVQATQPVLNTLTPILANTDSQLLFNDNCTVIEDFKKSMHRLESFKSDNNYSFSNSIQYLSYIFSNFISSGLALKKCENCGKYFVPFNRSDTIYCDRLSPQDKTKKCKEYGAMKAYKHNLKNNESMGLYRNIYMSKQMQAKRHRKKEETILAPIYEKEFEDYKINSKQWKSDVKAGTKTEQEYIEWLKAVKEKKVL